MATASFPALEKVQISSPYPFSGKRFNNTLWRYTAARICKNIDRLNVGLEIISAWGFEVLGDKAFLDKRLRRFYCYIGIPQHACHLDRQHMAHQFSSTLLDELNHIDAKFANDFVISVEQDRFVRLREKSYQCKSTDKLIDTQCRYVQDSILEDYSRYIIAMLDGIRSKKGECRDFEKNKVSRNRLYQLYIMQEALFNSFIPSFTTEQKMLYEELFQLLDNRIQLFYQPALISTPLTTRETLIVECLIEPRINLMHDVCRQAKDPVDICCLSYHVEEELRLTVDKTLYQDFLSKLIRSYLHY